MATLLATLAVALGARREVMELSASRATGTAAMFQQVAALERAVASLRGHVLSGDPALLEDWRLAWNERLLPGLGGLRDMQGRWTEEDGSDLAELERRLAALHEAQRRVASAEAEERLAAERALAPLVAEARSSLEKLSRRQSVMLEAQSQRAARRVDLLVAIVLVVALVLPLPVWLAARRDARRIVEPVAELSRATKQLVEGDLEHPVKADGPLEIAELVRSFNRMWAAMRRGEVALREEAWANGEFLASVSHSARTPLNGIIGLVELLLEEERRPEGRRTLEQIRECGDQLLQLLNALFDYSRLEIGRVEVTATDFAPDELIDRAVRDAGHVADARGSKLRARWRAPAPGAVCGPASVLHRCAVEVICHAALRAAGDVEIEAWTSADGDSVCTVHLLVHDSGPEVAEARRHRVFEPFGVEPAPSTKERHDATGLELAIAARLCELFDGELAFERDEEGCNVFHLAIPCSPRPDAAGPPDAEPLLPLFPRELPRARGETAAESLAAHPLKLLVAEDDPVNQRVAVELLEHRGHQVTLVADGVAALDAVRCREPGYFGAILMDVQMPGMDGLEATRAIRRWESQHAVHTRIVALTAHARSGDRERCVDAGMDDYLAKPLRPADLYRALERSA